jgi:hypothetical protein
MEYRRNWDKIPVSQWAVNVVHDIEDLTTYPVTEPVTEDELAEYLLLSSYVPGSLLKYISDARARIEAAAEVSLVAHTYKVTVDIVRPYKLPYGGGTITNFSTPGGVITDYEYLNNYVNTPVGEFNEITYTTIPLSPEITKMAVIRLASFMFENRGDKASDTVLSKKAHDLSTPFSKKIWLV